MTMISFFLAYNFCQFCVVISTTMANDIRLRRISTPDFIHYIVSPILTIEKEPVFSFLMLGAKQGNYWYHFDDVFRMTRSLTGDWTRKRLHSKPALYCHANEETVISITVLNYWEFTDCFYALFSIPYDMAYILNFQTIYFPWPANSSLFNHLIIKIWTLCVLMYVD